MSLDAIEEITFPTPGGHEATFLYRPDTTDWNTVASCCKEDEYGLPSGLSGWAADIGAHIGGATVALALDNPDLCIIALEPLPENLDMLRANVARNGIGDRVAIVEGAVGVDVIFYGWSATPSMVAHRYIGNMVGESLAPQSEVHPTVYTLSGLLDLAGNPLVFLKTDCEEGNGRCSMIRASARSRRSPANGTR